LEKKCGETFPGVRAIVGWTFGRNDALLLVDAGGKPVLEMLEVEAGMYEGLRPNEGRYLLQNAAVAAASRDRPADDMFGEWAFVRSSVPGKPICALTLANTAADADNFAINLKPGCDQQIARFGPVAWRMDRGQLVLQSGKGQVWRFEENDPDTWDLIPRGRQPLSLVREEQYPACSRSLHGRKRNAGQPSFPGCGAAGSARGAVQRSSGIAHTPSFGRSRVCSAPPRFAAGCAAPGKPVEDSRLLLVLVHCAEA